MCLLIIFQNSKQNVATARSRPRGIIKKREVKSRLLRYLQVRQKMVVSTHGACTRRTGF